MHPSFRCLALATIAGFSVSLPLQAAHPSQGLWVGDIALNAVNESTGAVGNSNTFEFTDPRTTTPTSDRADLRLILHVNGAGQVYLLKSVAIIEKEVFADGSSDLVLLTDPSLYSQYPGIAKRIAAAAFDFGNPSAVAAVQTLIDTATNSAVTQILATPSATASAVETSVNLSLQPVVSGANVSLAYLNRASGASSFLTTHFFSEAEVITLANLIASQIHSGARTVAQFAFNPLVDQNYQPFATDPLPGSGFTNRVTQAQQLRSSSFYGDTRGLEAIAGVVTAAAEAAASTSAGADLITKQAVARMAAIYARHNAADTTQAYNRFLAGDVFSAMRKAMPDVAVTAAINARNDNQNQTQIATRVRSALLSNTMVSSASSAAVAIKSASLWGDVRAEDAVNSLLHAAANAAAAQVMLSLSPAPLKKAIEDELNAAFASLPSAPVFFGTPSADYNQFVSQSQFQSAASQAAKTAAAEVVFQYAAGVRGQTELRFYANRAVTKALGTIREAAAIIPQNEIRLLGQLMPGQTIEGTLQLPALAPSNPFMHRRHPDHTEGFAITRKISLSVDPSHPEQPTRAGYGVSQITGVYFEEIFGLHKPLGASQNIGLRTRGTFTLNRLTFTDSLNF